jgi:D-alanyl-D-alanine carboxypeptidase
MFTFNAQAALTPLQTAIEALKAEGSTPAAIGRVETANITAAAATGTANLATGEAATSDARYEVGSQTKMMTAVIVLQLEAEGKINLDAPASQYLSPADIAGIANSGTATVRQLLEMRSGIPSYTDVATSDGISVFTKELLANPDKSFTTDDALAIVRGIAATSAPGEFYYSNTNYTLLGKIIEGITHEPLAQTFETRIFTPAGMTHSDLVGANAPGDGLHGYLTSPSGELLDTTFAKWDKGAEGGVVSTTEDMIKFVKALLVNQTLLPAAQLAEMKNTMIVADSPELQFKFGLGLLEFTIPGAGTFYGFNGGTLGHESNTYISQKTGAIVSLDVNQAETVAKGDAAAYQLLTQLAQDPAWQPITSFDPASDTMRIDMASAASANIGVNGNFEAGFGDATLKLPLAFKSVTTSNIQFADGSLLIVGDNASGTQGDDKANSIDIAKQFASAEMKDNQVFGLGGDDDIRAGSGNDKLFGGDGRDRLWGRDGNDTLDGGDGRDELHGGKGQDILNGGNGRDLLDGGAGADTLTGGRGRDIFDFDSLSDLAGGDGSHDIITDFTHGEDVIDLSGIDANTSRRGDQSFHFIGEADFSGKAGQLHIKIMPAVTGIDARTIIEGDVNGDGKADFSLELAGQKHLSVCDFFL